MIATRRFKDTRIAVLAQIMAAIFGLAGLAVLWWSGTQATSAVRARRYGARIAVLVLRIAVLMHKGQDQNERRLIWQTPDGRFDQSMRHQAADVQHLQPNDLIYVFCGPNRSWWEGDTGPRETIASQVPVMPRR